MVGYTRQRNRGVWIRWARGERRGRVATRACTDRTVAEIQILIFVISYYSIVERPLRVRADDDIENEAPRLIMQRHQMPAAAHRL